MYAVTFFHSLKQLQFRSCRVSAAGGAAQFSPRLTRAHTHKHTRWMQEKTERRRIQEGLTAMVVIEIWYTTGRSHRPATGFLEERLWNVRKRLRSTSRLRKCTISDERALQLKEWLRNNSQPLSQIETYMENTAVYRAKWIRDNNWTIDEILEEFPHLMTKDMPGINMVEYLHEAKVCKPYPHILTLGNGQSAFQAFVIIAGQALEQEALLQAIDVCFKAFFVFDMKYPKQCEYVWEFIQTVIYEMPGGKSKMVKFLQNRILACN
ncbi:uncharacterized protein LOC120567860 [Perca fluviatilis]|uniref:uncharacterized protein LOC120567860 n=1 Tax=Perca fluviatilis TaxID=8168 RepID=UPI00196421BD|nr:uncharacterized protein LOC120567860 [Perca fluviatilis]